MGEKAPSGHPSGRRDQVLPARVGICLQTLSSELITPNTNKLDKNINVAEKKKPVPALTSLGCDGACESGESGGLTWEQKGSFPQEISWPRALCAHCHLCCLPPDATQGLVFSYLYPSLQTHLGPSPRRELQRSLRDERKGEGEVAGEWDSGLLG